MAFVLLFCSLQNSFGQHPDTARLADTAQLKVVIIRAQKPIVQQQPGGMVINAGSSVLTKGSSALEVLERSPGVVIDHQNNAISLNGKTGVMVMIDGRSMRMPMDQVVTLLNGMSADEIDKIELLTSPPAKYDAEGSAGIINIVLKKNKQAGTNGSLSLTGGYGWGEKGTASFNLAHNTRKIDLYGSYTYTHDRSYNDLFVTGSQDFPPLGGQIDNLTSGTTKPIQNTQDATIGLDARLNPKTTIGGSITYNADNVSTNTADLEEFNVLPDSLLRFTGNIQGINRWRNWTNSVYVEKKIREGEQINLGIDYLYYNNKNSGNIQSSFLNKDGKQAGTTDSLYSPSQETFARNAIQIGVVKLDFIKQLNKKLTFETGLKGTYTRDSSLSGIESLVNGAWVAGAETSNNIEMKESIGAAYASVNAQINPSTSLIIGLRYEYSHTHMDNPETGENTVDRKLGVLFPNISFSRKLNDHSDIQISYTKRISRPSYNDLASYIGYSGPVAAYTGNPLLQPTISNNLKLGYNYRGYSFSILLSRDDNPIARYQLSENPAGNLLYISPQNLDWQNYLTFQTNLPVKVNGWLTMNYGFVGGWRQFKEDFTPQPVEKGYFAYSANFSETFKLPGRLSAEISGWYDGPSYNGVVKIDGFGALNAGIKKELKNDKGTFQLSVSDILRTISISGYHGSLTEEAFSEKNHFIYNTESTRSPIIKLTYTRSFGSGAVKSQRKSDAGAKDESDRIRKE